MSNKSESDCTALENQIKRLEATQARLQKSLQKAAGEEKQSLLREIRELESEIRPKQMEFNLQRCRRLNMKWTVAGEPREALVFPPFTAGKHPLIFAWHGHGGSMEGAAEQMHFQTVWPEAIVVYAQGLTTKSVHDKDGQGAGWQKETDPKNRDLKLFDAMLATMRAEYSIDDSRIYTAGFSNGTGFSYLLWVERGRILAAIGAVSGVLLDPERHKPTPPRALISIAGSAGIAPDAVQATVDRARQINGTGPRQTCDKPDGAPKHTKCHFYPSPTTPVKQITYPGGHEYPSWAPDEILRFFMHHQRPQG